MNRPATPTKHTVYSFALDGPTYAAHLRELMREQLVSSGELPASAQLELPAAYRDMQASGQLWVDSRGLPMRQIIDMRLAPEAGKDYRVEAHMEMDFSDYGGERVAAVGDGYLTNLATAFAWHFSPAQLARSIDLNGLGSAMLLVLLATLLAFALIQQRRHPNLHAAINLTIVASMLLSPLLQAQVAHAEQAQLDRFTARQSALETTSADLLTNNMRAEMGADRPNDSAALSNSRTAAQTTDTDGDGLPDVDDVCPADVDCDGDTLTDYEEDLLGTNALMNDSDVDGIADNLEVEGFLVGAVRWHSDPNLLDSNDDGIADSLEWDESNQDFDGDGTPNIHDFDNDGDGVPDRLDVSLFSATKDDAGNVITFNDENPLELIVDDLDVGKITYVDFQIRPINPDHLWYAFNVLNWPHDDEGQVQDIDNKTFFDLCIESGGSDCNMGPDDNVDIRFVPMLEITLPSDNGNLPLQTVKSVTVNVTPSASVLDGAPDGRSQGTMTLTQQGDDVYAEMDMIGPNANNANVGGIVRVYEGSCANQGDIFASAFTAGGFVSPMIYEFPSGSIYDQTVTNVNLSQWADGKHVIGVHNHAPNYLDGCGQIPMLISEGGQTVDNGKLEPYQITLRKGDDAGTTNLALVPLQLVTDPQTGEHVAFSGKMLYQAGQRWDTQQVRMVWAVQMLTDGGCAQRNLPGRPDLCTREQDNIPQIIHTYPGSFYLTGLDVREDHGVDMAIIYEDPTVDTDWDADGRLMRLTRGLHETLFVNRDCDAVDPDGNCIHDGERDITIPEIARRFDHTGNAGISQTARWGIDNVLGVETYRFDHIEQALAETSGKHTPAILAAHFTAPWYTEPLSPTLMYAYEQTYRASNLDAKLLSNGGISWSGNAIQINMNGNGSDVTRTATIKFSPYQFDPVRASWEAFPMADYWFELERRLTDTPQSGRAATTQPDPLTEEEVLLTQVVYAQFEAGDTAENSSAATLSATSDGVTIASDADLNAINLGVRAGARLLYFLPGESRLFRQAVAEFDLEFKNVVNLNGPDGRRLPAANIARAKANKVAKLAALKQMRTRRFASKTTAVLSLAATGLGLAGSLFGSGGVQSASEVVLTSVDAASQVYHAVSLAQLGGTVGKTTASLTTAQKALHQTLAGLRQARVGLARATIIGAIIAGVITWGVFFVQLASADTNSIEFNALLANTVASTIVLVATVIISLVSVAGAILLAVVAVIDLILFIICKAGVDALCGVGILVSFTSWFSDALYTGDVLIDVEREKPPITNLRGLSPGLREPEKGFVPGNALVFSADIRSIINHKPPSGTFKDVVKDDEFYTPQDLARTTFNYTLSQQPQEISAELDQMNALWTGIKPFATKRYIFEQIFFRERETQQFWYGIADKTATTEPIPIMQAGRNQTFQLFLNTGAAFPTYGCWVGNCSFEAPVTNSSSTPIGDSLAMDIFPATLDEFYNMGRGEAGGGWVGLVMDQADHDGDGLISPNFNGSDPHPNSWDADGDKLSDRFELEQQALGRANGGYLFDPLNADADSDTLNDAREWQLGTNPNQADSDGDGLDDHVEVNGWMFTYAPGKTMRVSSNPLLSDSDLDGMTDLLEMQLHAANAVAFPFHPLVYNESPVGLYAALSDSDGVVEPGDVLTYTAQVVNNIAAPLIVDGTLTTDMPAALGGGTQTDALLLTRASAFTQSVVATASGGSATVPISSSVAADVSATDLNASYTWSADAPTTFDAPVRFSTLLDDTLLTLESADFTPQQFTNAVVNSLTGVTFQSRTRGGAATEVFDAGSAETAAYPLNIACTYGDSCLVVWAERTSASAAYSVMGQLNGGTPFAIASGSATEQHLYPSVASNGSDFVVAWSRQKEGNFELVVRSVSAAGALGTVSRLDNQLETVVTEADLFPAIAATGSSYTVVWQHDHSTSDSEIWQAQVSASGAYVANSISALTADSVLNSTPHIAFNDTSAQSLVVWINAGDHVMAKVGSADAAIVGNRGQQAAITAPQAHLLTSAELPASWVVSWQARTSATDGFLHYQSLTADGQPHTNKQSVAWQNGAMAASTADCTATACQLVRTTSGGVRWSAATLTFNGLTGNVGSLIVSETTRVTIDDDNPDAATLIVGNFIVPDRSVVVGGKASDPTSYITTVEVSIDGGAFQPATGAEMWAFEWDVPAGDATYTIDVRSTDAVGNSTVTRFNAVTDNVPPALTITQATDSRVPLRRDANNKWVFDLDGTVSDATSGVEQVTIAIDGNTTQIAALAAGTWSHSFTVDDFSLNNQLFPSNPITLSVTAIDNADPAGNSTTVVRRLLIDEAGPAADLQSHPPNAQLKLGTQITGTISDTHSAVSAVEVAFTRAELLDSMADPRLLMPFDDAIGSRFFADVSADNRLFTCTDITCPTTGVAGQYGRAVQFDGVDDMIRPIIVNSPYDILETDYTLSLWFNTSCADCGIFSAVSGDYPSVAGVDRSIYLENGNVCMNVWTGASFQTGCSAFTNYADSAWHQLFHTIGAEGNRLYVNGTLAVSTAATSSAHPQNSVHIGWSGVGSAPYFDGMLDELAIYDVALSSAEISSLYRNWQPATLDNDGWQHTIPAGLEGYYQIDVRGTDAHGNQTSRDQWRTWRGLIDSQSPRVAIDVAYDGIDSTAQTLFTVSAEDDNLTTDQLVNHCNTASLVRGYRNDAWRQEWGDGQQLNRLSSDCTASGFQTGELFARACDTLGNCGAAVPEQTWAYLSDNGQVTNENGSNDIVRFNLYDGSGRETVVERLHIVRDIDFDELRGHLYWVEVDDSADSAAIWRADLNGNNPTQLRGGIAGSASGIRNTTLAVDAAGNKLYWSEQQYIRRANLDMSNVETVWSFVPISGDYCGLDYAAVNALEIDHDNNKLIWSFSRWLHPTADAVFTANLNGTGLTQIAGASLDWTSLGSCPFAGAVKIADLHVVPQNDQLFWVDYDAGVVRANLDGSGATTIIDVPRVNFWTSLHADAPSNTLYWLQYDRLYRAGLDGSDYGQLLPGTQGVRTVMRAITLPGEQFAAPDMTLTIAPEREVVVGVQNVAVVVTATSGYVTGKHPQVTLNLPTGLSYVSATPDICIYAAAQPERVTCTPTDDIKHESPLVIDLTLNVAAGEQGALPITGVISAENGEHNPNNNTVVSNKLFTTLPYVPTDSGGDMRVYYGAYQAIRERNIATGADALVASTGGNVYAVDVDATNAKIYWSEDDTGTLRRANLDGTQVETLVTGLPTGSFPTTAVDVLVVEQHDKLYWTNDLDVWWANLDGSDAAQFWTPVNNADLRRNGTVLLSGALVDTLSVESVAVQIDGGAWMTATADVTNNRWEYAWQVGDQATAENGSFPVTVKLTDGAGRTAQVIETVRVDLIPPEPPTMTVALTGGQPISRGATIRNSNPSMTINWTAPVDVNGIANVYAGWTDAATATLGELTAYSGGAGSHTQTLGEAQIKYAHLIVVDDGGNQVAQNFGPVYFDSAVTPDLIDHAPDVWLNTASNQFGRFEAQAGTQQLFASWNATHLSFVYEGGNWNSDGDLFLYLDTGAGGEAPFTTRLGQGQLCCCPVDLVPIL